MADALDTLLNKTLPNFLGQEISNLRTEARFQAQEERDQKKYLQEWNRNETRYQDKIRTEREERNEERDRIIISRGSEMDLDKRNEYYGHLDKSGRMKSVFGYDLLEGEMSRSRSDMDRSSTLMQGIDIYNLDDFEYNQIQNMYKSGNFEKAYEELTKALDRKVDPKNYPEINLSAKSIASRIDTNAKALVDPLNLLDAKQEDAIRGEIGSLQSELSTLLAPLSRLKVPGIGGGKVLSTDYGLFQINDTTFDKHSQSFFGKPTKRLNPEENIRFASWIVKNQPRTIGGVKSGWNNWSVFFGKDKKTGEELYKKNLNKSDAYYMAGGLSESNLRLIEREFGNDAPIAKAVMFSESSGKHSSINQNLAGGKSKTGSLKDITEFKPFEGEWNQVAIDYMANELGVSKEELKKDHGAYISSNFLQKYSDRPNLSSKRAKEKLISFTKELKNTLPSESVDFTVPSGKHQGKKLNKSIVADLLKSKRQDDWQSEMRKGKIIYGMTAGAKYEWLDTFAQELGFDSAEELNSKEGAMAMKDYYSGKRSQTGQIDFEQPFTITR